MLLILTKCLPLKMKKADNLNSVFFLLPANYIDLFCGYIWSASLVNKQVKMKNIAKGINQILAEWDPLDVGRHISYDEYSGYVPRIMRNIESKESLTSCLEDILNNSLYAGYDDNNDEHKKMLAATVEKIKKLKDINP